MSQCLSKMINDLVWNIDFILEIKNLKNMTYGQGFISLTDSCIIQFIMRKRDQFVEKIEND